MPDRDRVRISVWSDYVCPFCYLEEPVLQQLRTEYGERIEVDWRAFELRPEPAPTLDPDGEYLHTTWDRAVYPMAERRGMTLRLPPVQPRSRRALEAAEFARDRGRFEEMHFGLFRAFFEEGRDIGELEVLLDAGAAAGLERDELRAALREGRYTDKVLADQQLARRLGISGVPSLLIAPADAALGEGEMVTGAQPYERVRDAVERALRGEGRGAHTGPVFRRGLPTLGG